MLDQPPQSTGDLATCRGLVRVHSRALIDHDLGYRDTVGQRSGADQRRRRGKASLGQTGLNVVDRNKVGLIDRRTVSLHDDAPSVSELNPVHAADAGREELIAPYRRTQLIATEAIDRADDPPRVGAAEDVALEPGLTVCKHVRNHLDVHRSNSRHIDSSWSCRRRRATASRSERRSVSS